MAGRVQPRQRGIQRGGLARAGRAGDQHDAVRLGDQFVELRQHFPAHAQILQVEPACFLVQQAQHRALAVRGGQRGDPHVDRLPPTRSVMRPSCGRRFSAMSSCAMILMREISAACSAFFGLTTSRSAAVDAEAHHRDLLEGLDVDIDAPSRRPGSAAR